jgi:hypothetical protein
MNYTTAHKIKDAVTIVSSIIAAVVTLGTISAFLLGFFTNPLNAAIDGLRKSQTEYQERIEHKFDEAFQRREKQMADVLSRLDALPNPREVGSMQTQLAQNTRDIGTLQIGQAENDVQLRRLIDGTNALTLRPRR